MPYGDKTLGIGVFGVGDPTVSITPYPIAYADVGEEITFHAVVDGPVSSLYTWTIFRVRGGSHDIVDVRTTTTPYITLLASAYDTLFIELTVNLPMKTTSLPTKILVSDSSDTRGTPELFNPDSIPAFADIKFDPDQADFVSEIGLDTSIFLALFTDGRVPEESDVDIPHLYDRNGWWTHGKDQPPYSWKVGSSEGKLWQIYAYRITNDLMNWGNYPTDWELYGINEDESEVLIDKQAGISFVGYNQKDPDFWNMEYAQQTFKVSNHTKFRYFKFIFLKYVYVESWLPLPECMIVGEIELLGYKPRRDRQVI